MLDRKYQDHYTTKGGAKSVPPVTLPCEPHDIVMFVGQNAGRWLSVESEPAYCGVVYNGSFCAVRSLSNHGAVWLPSTRFLRTCKTFCTSAITVPVSSLTSTENVGSIFSCVCNSRRTSSICCSDNRKAANTLPFPGFRKRMFANLSHTMSADVVAVPDAQLHLHIDGLPIGLQACHADARPKEGRPEIDEPAQVPLHDCHIESRRMQKSPTIPHCSALRNRALRRCPILLPQLSFQNLARSTLRQACEKLDRTRTFVVR